jgi:hypothetical protein
VAKVEVKSEPVSIDKIILHCSSSKISIAALTILGSKEHNQ